MLPSVNDLLEEWEQIKHCGCPTGENIKDLSGYLQTKNTVDTLAQEIRQCRLRNDYISELKITPKFVEAYYDFNRDFVYRTLKNDRAPQS